VYLQDLKIALNWVAGYTAIAGNGREKIDPEGIRVGFPQERRFPCLARLSLPNIPLPIGTWLYCPRSSRLTMPAFHWAIDRTFQDDDLVSESEDFRLERETRSKAGKKG
jgi:hypothetical protein